MGEDRSSKAKGKRKGPGFCFPCYSGAIFARHHVDPEVAGIIAVSVLGALAMATGVLVIAVTRSIENHFRAC